MNATLEVSKKDQFLAPFQATEGLALPSQDAAKAALVELEFPTSKTEAWKYTRVGRILNGEYSSAPNSDAIDIAPYVLEGFENNVLVFVNGHYRLDLSNFENLSGLMVRELGDAVENYEELIGNHAGTHADHKNEIFTALNTAHATGGAFIHAKDNAIVETPIQLLHLQTGDGTSAQPRHFIVANRMSQLSVVATYHSLGEGKNFNNGVTEIFVGQNAKVNFDKLQYENGNSFHIATDQVYQERDSNFTINTMTLNGGLVRNNLNIIVNGENCETNLNGLYMLKDAQHIDNHTMVDHKVPHCESNELYKGIIDGKATAVFNGKVFVRQAAQKTNAFQSNANILLSDDATINSKPELEIYADDVKCSHGSTTGQFDEEAVFYLRARGLSEKSARQLLVSAFAGEVLEHIEIEAVEKAIEGMLEERFGWKQ